MIASRYPFRGPESGRGNSVARDRSTYYSANCDRTTAWLSAMMEAGTGRICVQLSCDPVYASRVPTLPEIPIA